MLNIDIYNGKSRKSGKEFEAVRVTIGDWSSLVFPRSKFEMDYIKKILSENK